MEPPSVPPAPIPSGGSPWWEVPYDPKEWYNVVFVDITSDGTEVEVRKDCRHIIYCTCKAYQECKRPAKFCMHMAKFITIQEKASREILMFSEAVTDRVNKRKGFVFTLELYVGLVVPGRDGQWYYQRALPRSIGLGPYSARGILSEMQIFMTDWVEMITQVSINQISLADLSSLPETHDAYEAYRMAKGRK